MQLDKKLFVGLFFAFIAMTIIGTQSHEFGHYIVARCLGYQSTIHIGSTRWSDPGNDSSIFSTWKQNKDAIRNHEDFPGKATFLPLWQKRLRDGHYITLGGPLQTMLTGTLGFNLLLLSRKKFFQAEALNIKQWALIFLSLFWLRQPANDVTALIMRFIKGKFGKHGDEIILAHYWHLPAYSVALVTGIIGAIIAAIVIFKFIPDKQRLTFIFAGFFAGLIGYSLWLILLGPVSIS